MKELKKGSVVNIPPDEAARYGDSLRLVDMKKSLYRVEETVPMKKAKVKRAPRKAADKG